MTRVSSANGLPTSLTLAARCRGGQTSFYAAVPSTAALMRASVFERYLDEMGAFRVCVLSPFGSRVHAPWATAVASIVQSTR